MIRNSAETRTERGSKAVTSKVGVRVKLAGLPITLNPEMFPEELIQFVKESPSTCHCGGGLLGDPWSRVKRKRQEFYIVFTCTRCGTIAERMKVPAAIVGNGTQVQRMARVEHAANMCLVCSINADPPEKYYVFSRIFEQFPVIDNWDVHSVSDYVESVLPEMGIDLLMLLKDYDGACAEMGFSVELIRDELRRREAI